MRHKVIFTLVFCFAVLFSLSGNERKLIAEGMKLERARKYQEALAFYNKAIKENPKLSPTTLRYFLNRCGSHERDVHKRIDYFRRACLVKGKNPTENYRTYLWLGGCYRRTDPQKALGYFQNMPDKKAIHPSLIYQGNMEIGKVYEQIGKKDLAVAAYEEALAAGKSITYKYNYSHAEKALKRLKK